MCKCTHPLNPRRARRSSIPMRVLCTILLLLALHPTNWAPPMRHCLITHARPGYGDPATEYVRISGESDTVFAMFSGRFLLHKDGDSSYRLTIFGRGYVMEYEGVRQAFFGTLDSVVRGQAIGLTLRHGRCVIGAYRLLHDLPLLKGIYIAFHDYCPRCREAYDK